MFVRLSVFGHLIMELRRVTAHSESLIDLCITKISSSSPFTPQEQRPSTVSLHSLRSCASLSSWYQLLPMDLISAFNERLQVFCGWLLFRLFWVLQVKACPVMVQEAFRWVWSSHFHFRLRIASSTEVYPALCYNWMLLTLSDHTNCKILRLHLLNEIWSFFVDAFVDLQVSEP